MKTYPHIQALLRRARWRASVRLHTRTADDLAELTAYGWIGLLSAVAGGHRGPGYLYTSAYRMMMREYTRQREHDALVFAAHIDLAARRNVALRDKRSMPADLQDDLFALFLASRKKRGWRGEQASQRDVQIVALAWEGFNNEGIAQEMGMTPHEVATYRRRLQNRLLTKLPN